MSALTSLPAVISVGVLVMAVLLAVALGAVPGPTRVADPGPPLPTVPLPVLPPSEPGATASAGTAASGTTPPSPGRSPSGSASAVPPPAPPTAPSRPADRPTLLVTPPAPPSTTASTPVSGGYRVVETFVGGFIGEVLVTNESSVAQDWTVRLELPRGRLVTAWTEGAPQGTVSGSNGSWVFTSGSDLAPGESVTLRFEFTGTKGNTRPSGCTVDGVACTGL